MAEENTPATARTHHQPDQEPDRQAQPVDSEEPPRLAFPVVGIGASAGGLEAFSEFLAATRPDSGMAFVLIQHLPPDRESMMVDILSRRTAMTVRQVEDGMAVEPNHVYVIRPGHVLTIRNGTLHLGPALGTPRAANRPIDDFFKSLAEEQRERAICVVLSGMGSNGTAGAQAVKAVGGLCVAQDPDSAQCPSMPRHLIDAGYADHILRPAEIAPVLLAYAASPYATGGREADAALVLDREGHHMREILAVLRTRTKQDFSGYKKPTVLRRVQRRMGLARVPALGDYARLLRQAPAEVAALADDLLIHVTGFFRDPDAWDALREKVVTPLVEGREVGGAVRAWVTACSSGEEAYSLAMLLIEEAERVGKPLDIKVFATDLAERSLAHARGGVYPGGIESEVGPERLARFFTKDGEMYRVRPELRDRVVFAPQNVLQDPPFSRLDIASCRNLLIYLEPEVQHRVLALLHFGLHEGGALFLGSSETAAGAEELFEPIDKRARIFRRVGPMWHGSTSFPVPRALSAAGTGFVQPRAPRHNGARASVAQLAQRALLDHHTPAAVAVDREGRVLYFHGDTQPFLLQPTGDPTRDLMLLAREGVRGAVRVALHRAATEGRTATAADGWVQTAPDRRVCVVVTASPVPGLRPDDAPGPPEHFVVSFAPYPDVPAASAGTGAEPVRPSEELRRLRGELQSTIEELQTSNEELKASNEEVMSVNEELQSANEELETSKEEMQSLNEELTTVNAELRAKMDEHEAASNDLASLLTSTDIAVLFLDTTFRIRRYTPAARDLVDLIAGDVGRPLAALARKFDDPNLDNDCLTVLERLASVEREVAGASGRHFLRRVTPYRTTDNRIDGIVVTFVDISARKRAEEALSASEEQFRRAIEDAPIPVIMQAEDGQVLQLSRTWTELTGYTLTEVPTAETWLTRAYGPGADSVRNHMHELFKGGRLALDVEFVIRTKGGADRYWSFSASAPGTLRDGRRFLVGMAVDVTDRQRAEAALRAGEERLRLALAAARMGIWTLEVGTGVQMRDANLNRLLGLAPVDTTQPFDEFLAHIHPDDRGVVRAAFAASSREGQPLRVEFRVVWPDGSIRWLRDQGDVFGPARGAGHMTGACTDVTERQEVEQALKASEERLRLILESATDFAIITLAPDRTVTGWSPGAEALFKWAEAEIVGQRADVLFTPEDRRAGAPAAEAEAARRTGRAQDERWHLRKDASRFWASGVLTPLGTGGGRGFVKVLRDLTGRKRMEDELRGARDQLEARVAERTAELRAVLTSLESEMARRATLARRLATVQEDERRRIARDLHDTVGQTLTGLSLAVAGVATAGPLAAPTAERLDQVRRLADELGRELYEVALLLRPTALDDIGLETAVRTLATDWARRAGLAVEVTASKTDGRFPPEVETALYRVVQEALTNVAKHAGASRVSVVLGRRDADAVVVVEDDGAGFDPDAARTPTAGRRGGVGLAGMRERVALLGGVVEVESEPGRGTTLIARIPVGGP